MNYTYSVCPHCHSVNKIKTEKALRNEAICGHCREELSLQELVSEVSPTDLLKLQRSSDLPILVDFWAPWCGPCKLFAPTFANASRELQGKVVLVKLNTEVWPQAGSQFGIRGIPTIVLFNKQNELARQSGVIPLPMLVDWVRSNLTRAA